MPLKVYESLHRRLITRATQHRQGRVHTVGTLSGVAEVFPAAASPSPENDGSLISTTGESAAVIRGASAAAAALDAGGAAAAGAATTAGRERASGAPRIRSACSNAPAKTMVAPFR